MGFYNGPSKIWIDVINNTASPYRFPNGRLRKSMAMIEREARRVYAQYPNDSAYPTIRLKGHVSPRRKRHWVVTIQDGSDPDVDGYHFWDPTDKIARSLIYGRNILTNRAHIVDDEYALTEVLSHEIFEMVANPVVNNLVAHDHGGGVGVRNWLREVSDPVESESWAVVNPRTSYVTILADWVDSDWFRSASGPMDEHRAGTCSGHHHILAGSELAYVKDGVWHTQHGDWP